MRTTNGGFPEESIEHMVALLNDFSKQYINMQKIYTSYYTINNQQERSEQLMIFFSYKQNTYTTVCLGASMLMPAYHS